MYMPSPVASPDDLLEPKPLDLSSKSLSSESTVRWMTPDARCDHHVLGHSAVLSHEALLLSNLASSFEKSESPAAESGSTDDGSIGGLSRIRSLTSRSFLKHLSGGIGDTTGLTAGPGAAGSLSTEDLIARVLEAKASGRYVARSIIS